MRRPALAALVALALLASVAGLAGVARQRDRSPLVRTIQFAQSMGPVTVDPRTGYAFVLTWSPGSTGQVSALDTRTGRLIRTIAVGSAPGGGTGALGIDHPSGHVFVAVDGDAATGTAASVTMLAARTMTVLRRTAIAPAPIGVTVDEAAGSVTVTSLGAAPAGGRPGGIATIFEAATGRLARVVGAPIDTIVAEDPRAGRRFIFERGGDGRRGVLSVIDARTGRILRHAVLASTPSAVTVDEGRQRVFALADRTVTTFDARTGRPLCSAPVGGGAAAIAVDARTGRVFVARAPFGSGGLGAIMTLDASSGRPLRTLTLTGNPTTLAVDARHGHVFATDAGRLDGRGGLAGGGLDVLDARSGALLRRIPLGGIPGEVAIDEGTGRIVVASGSSSGAALPSPWDWIPGRLRRALRLPVPSSRTIGGSVTLLDLSR